MRDGCLNCEVYLELAGRLESVLECTSATFDGMIALQDPQASWVAKWQRLDGFKPGLYAVTVTGVVSLVFSIPLLFILL